MSTSVSFSELECILLIFVSLAAHCYYPGMLNEWYVIRVVVSPTDHLLRCLRPVLGVHPSVDLIFEGLLLGLLTASELYGVLSVV